MNSLEFAELATRIEGISLQISELAKTLWNNKEEVKSKAELYGALAQAKLKYRVVTFNRVNSFNKQVYADLEAIQRATNQALSEEGLSFIQMPIDVDGTTFLDSILTHSSGQELRCRNRLIIPGYTGAKSDLQRYGESLAYLKRQVAQCVLGVVACNDEADNDDADAAEVMYNTQTRKAMSGDESKPTVDQGIVSEKITKDQLEDLYYELQEYPVMTQALLKGLEIKQLADMPRAKYHREMERIRSQKIMLRDKPRKEW